MNKHAKAKINMSTYILINYIEKSFTVEANSTINIKKRSIK